VFFDEAGLDVAADEFWVGCKAFQKVNVGVETDNFEFTKCFAKDTEGSGAVFALDDEFGDHGVVVDTDLVTLTDAGFDTDFGGGFGE
jgi:hypothetical protein